MGGPWLGVYSVTGAVWTESQAGHREVPLPDRFSVQYSDNRSHLSGEEPPSPAEMTMLGHRDRNDPAEAYACTTLGFQLDLDEPPELSLRTLWVTVPLPRVNATWGIHLLVPSPWLGGDGDVATEGRSGPHRFDVRCKRSPLRTELSVSPLGQPAPYLTSFGLTIVRSDDQPPWRWLHIDCRSAGLLHDNLNCDLELGLTESRGP